MHVADDTLPRIAEDAVRACVEALHVIARMMRDLEQTDDPTDC